MTDSVCQQTTILETLSYIIILIFIGAQSYENLAEQTSEDEHDYEETTNDVQINIPNVTETADDDHDYEEAGNDVHDYEQNIDDDHDYVQDMGDVHDYEQDKKSFDAQSCDYVKVEDEAEIFLPPPPYQEPNPADNISMDSYDDIGGEDVEDDDGEDYDDVA